MQQILFLLIFSSTQQAQAGVMETLTSGLQAAGQVLNGSQGNIGLMQNMNLDPSISVGMQLQMAQIKAAKCNSDGEASVQKALTRASGILGTTAGRASSDDTTNSIVVQGLPLNCNTAFRINGAATAVQTALVKLKGNINVCLARLQTDINAAIESAMGQMSTMRDQAADYAGKLFKITNDIQTKLNGAPNGPPGLKAQLVMLKGLSTGLKQVLNGTSHIDMPGTNFTPPLKLGIFHEIEAVEKDRVKAAHTFTQTFNDDTMSCLRDNPMQCAGTKKRSPQECMQKYIQDSSLGKSWALNAGHFDELMGSLEQIVRSAGPARTQLGKPEDFLKDLQKSSTALGDKLKKTIVNFPWREGSISEEQVKNVAEHFERRYEECRKISVDHFIHAFKTEQGGSQQRSAAEWTTIVEKERALFNEMGDWVRATTEHMSQFGKEFYDNFDAMPLAARSEKCQAATGGSEADVQMAKTCIQQLSSVLIQRINGFGAPLTISIPSIAGGPGNYAVTSQPVQCNGFAKCIDVMEFAAKSADSSRTTFITQFNTQYKKNLSDIQAKVSVYLNMMASAKDRLTNQLNQLGVDAEVKMKAVDPETLGQDSGGATDQLLKTPRSLRGAIAGMQGGMEELDAENNKDVADAIKERDKELSETAQHAKTMMDRCHINAALYASLKGLNCRNICKSGMVNSMVSSAERAFRSAQNHTADGKGNINEESSSSEHSQTFSECVSETMKEQVGSGGEIESRERNAEATADAKRQATHDCGNAIASQLAGLAASSRGALSQINGDIAAKIQATIAACAEDKNSSVTSPPTAIDECRSVEAKAGTANSTITCLNNNTCSGDGSGSSGSNSTDRIR